MMHLLKSQFQPVYRSRSWRATIRTQRGRIERLLKQSPSLRREVPEISADRYGLAREMASAETGFALATFPESLPCTPEQTLQDDFFPGPIDDETR